MDVLQAVILAIIEGLTEFLPVSSTGHMIIGSWLMGIAADPFVKMFTVSIQLGAILAVVVYYWKRFFKNLDFYFKLIVAVIPALLAGALFKSSIDAMLENIYVVAISLLLGGIVLLFVDKWFSKNEAMPDREPDYKSGFIIGIFQCLAMVPGVSRAAASIIGGQARGLNRKSAAEFSFFLAVPTMFAATAKSLWDDKDLLLQSDSHNIMLLVIGNIVAFIVAMLAIKLFIGFLTRNGFKLFGWYRIVLGILILILAFTQSNLEMF